MRTRAEHLAWCKARALEFADRGDPVRAVNSLTRWLKEHPELAEHPDIRLGTVLLFGGDIEAPGAARKYIEGLI